MKKVLVLPTWILVRLITPFLSKEHLWNGKKFSLDDWATKSSELNNQFSLVFWVLGLSLLFLIWSL